MAAVGTAAAAAAAAVATMQTAMGSVSAMMAFSSYQQVCCVFYHYTDLEQKYKNGSNKKK